MVSGFVEYLMVPDLNNLFYISEVLIPQQILEVFYGSVGNRHKKMDDII